MERSNSEEPETDLGDPVLGMLRSALSVVRRFLPILLIGYWALLFIATHIPMPRTGTVRVNDKLAHLVAYSVLAFLLAWVISLRQSRRATWLLVVGICGVYGMTDELLQGTVASRTADIWDFVADVIGAALGASTFLVAQLCWRRWGRSRSGRVEQVEQPAAR